MSTLSSASSTAQILASYYDNASYEEDASVSKAKAFITACRFLILKFPKKAKEGGGSETEIDPSQIAREQAHARAWLSTVGNASTNGSVKYSSFENFRG